MKYVTYAWLAASFWLGVLLQPLLTALAAPYVGPLAIGPYLSTAIAVALGIGCVHVLTRNKSATLDRMWNEKTPSLTMLALLLLSGTGLLYGAAVVQNAEHVGFELHAAAGWGTLLNGVSAALVCGLALRALWRYHRG